MKGSPANRESAEDIERRAAEWVARLDLRGTPEELAALDVWLGASPRNHAAFLRLSVAWRRADCLRNLRPLDGKADPDLLIGNMQPANSGMTCAACVMASVVAVAVLLGVVAFIAFH